MNDGGTIGSGDVTNNSTLVFNPTTGTMTVTNNIVGTGTLTKSGAGTLLLSGGSLSYTGLTTLQGGTLEAIGAGGLGLLVGAGLDIQHGKAVLDYTGTGLTPAMVDPLVNEIMQAAHANLWVIDTTHPIGSTTANTDPLIHALGWTDMVSNTSAMALLLGPSYVLLTVSVQPKAWIKGSVFAVVEPIGWVESMTQRLARAACMISLTRGSTVAGVRPVPV